MFTMTKKTAQSEKSFREFFGPPSEPNYSRPTFLAQNRIGEASLTSEPEAFERFDCDSHDSYDSATEFGDKLELYELRKLCHDDWKRHEKTGKTAREYAGHVVESESIGYDNTERMPSRPMPTKNETYRDVEHDQKKFIGPQQQIDKERIVRVSSGFRDAGLRFKRTVTRQAIVRTCPKCPETETTKQILHWGDSTGYVVRQDGIEVAQHPLRFIVAELSEKLENRQLSSKQDAIDCIGELRYELKPYLIRMVGAFKKLVLEFGATGKKFQNQQTGKSTKFDWSDFGDFCWSVLSTFVCVEANNSDSRFRPVLNSFGYAVNREKQELRHQLRQNFNENAETERTVTDDTTQQDTVTSLNSRCSRLDSLTPVEKMIVEACAVIGQKKLAEKLGRSQSSIAGRLKTIRKKLETV